MRKMFLLGFVLASGSAMAQPKLINKAIIKTTTNVEAPEEEDMQDVQTMGGGGGGRGMNFRNFGDGETKSTTYLLDSMTKTVMMTGMGRTTIVRNNSSSLTTTLMEIMGKKMGFYATDDDQKNMGKMMDSMMKSQQKDSGQARRTQRPKTESEVHYTEEGKKIAGYNCKKAWIVNTNFLGQKDSFAVWYSPEIKMANLPSTGGTMGFGNTNSGFDKIDGFVMQYNRDMPRGRKMEVKVTNIEIEKNVAASEFDIPKDFDVKPMKEMGSMFGGRGGAGGGRTIVIGQ